VRLLDTCILIDLLRGREAAVAFISGLKSTPAISAITATELIAGARGKVEEEAIDRILATYEVAEIDLEIARLAGDYVRDFGKSHGVDPIDALIAATAKSKELDLATLNIKHFPMFKGLKRAYAT
jgi:predicted nucleic acid-binding protein